MASRTTIDDVARLASVSKATVSRALNPDTEHQVSAVTAKRIKRVATRLGYVPNVMARGLRTKLSMTVGVVIPDLTNPFFPPIVRAIEDHLAAHGYTALLANTDGGAGAEEAAFEALLTRRVDGFIMASGRRGVLDTTIRARAAGIPMVMLNRDVGDTHYPLVVGDDANGVTAAVEHLLALGHRDIVHVAGPADFSTSEVRVRAFLAACGARQGVRPRVVTASALSVDAGQHTMNEILDPAPGSRDTLTAIVAVNDLVATGVLRALRAHGLRCPEDVSVVGFNDMAFAEDFAPPLTTVRVPVADMGTEAARLLLRGIESGGLERITITLPVSLIVRGSTGPVAAHT
jgi:LacI family transcriptional regulator